MAIRCPVGYMAGVMLGVGERRVGGGSAAKSASFLFCGSLNASYEDRSCTLDGPTMSISGSGAGLGVRMRWSGVE